MKDRFPFYGIPSPLRKEIVTQVFGKYKLEHKTEFINFIKTCWAQPQREFKYAAMDISRKQLKRMDLTYISCYESLVGKESWWDTVDCLASNLLGPLLKNDPALKTEYCFKWIESEDIWYQRAAILVQLMYREQTDFTLLKKLILRRAVSKEFFIRKAAGWALRQYAKTDADTVKQFIHNHKLHPLTVREGLKGRERDSGVKGYRD